MDSRKIARLRSLARARRRADPPDAYPLRAVHAGFYECWNVSPYTRTAGNINAAIFVLLQDWASYDWLKSRRDWRLRRIGHDPALNTNKTLKRLLRTTFRVKLSETYATNAYPFLKGGAMGAAIPFAQLVGAVRQFALPQVQIVRPRLVICLGLTTFNAARVACHRKSIRPICSAIAKPFTYKGSRFWCQAHTGWQGQTNRNRGNPDRPRNDWRRMRRALQRRAQPHLTSNIGRQKE